MKSVTDRHTAPATTSPAGPHADPGHAAHGHEGHDHEGHDHESHDHEGHDRGGGHSAGDHLGHDHAGHSHSHLPSGPDAGRRMLLAMALTAVFLVAEVVGGVLSGSLALLADAGHMVTDVAALMLGYAGLRFATREADRQRTFGYARLEVLASFVNGIALLLLSAWILYEAATRFFEPVEVLSGPMMIIAVLGLLVNIGSFLLLRDGSDNINVQGAMVHVLGDLLGSVATIVAAVIIMTTGWMPADPLLSALVAILIIRSGWDITRRSANILLEGTPEGVDRDDIRQDLCAMAEVRDAFHLHVWALTTGRTLATLHVVPQAGYPPETVIPAVRARLRDRHGISHATIELDLSREAAMAIGPMAEACAAG